MPGMGMQWRSRRLANYYFGGISEDEAGPEHPAYEVGNALSFSSALITSYRFRKNGLGCCYWVTKCMIKRSATAHSSSMTVNTCSLSVRGISFNVTIAQEK